MQGQVEGIMGINFNFPFQRMHLEIFFLAKKAIEVIGIDKIPIKAFWKFIEGKGEFLIQGFFVIRDIQLNFEFVPLKVNHHLIGYGFFEGDFIGFWFHLHVLFCLIINDYIR